MKLTEKQKRFADYYVETGNATQSYIKAGYKATENIAAVEGYKLLRNPKMQNHIEERNKQLEDSRIADMKEVKQFWTDALREKGNDYKDRLKASEYIAKTNGAFLDKVEHSGSVTNKNIDMSDLTTEELRKLAQL